MDLIEVRAEVIGDLGGGSDYHISSIVSEKTAFSVQLVEPQVVWAELTDCYYKFRLKNNMLFFQFITNI